MHWCQLQWKIQLIGHLIETPQNLIWAYNWELSLPFLLKYIKPFIGEVLKEIQSVTSIQALFFSLLNRISVCCGKFSTLSNVSNFPHSLKNRLEPYQSYLTNLKLPNHRSTPPAIESLDRRYLNTRMITIIIGKLNQRQISILFILEVDYKSSQLILYPFGLTIALRVKSLLSLTWVPKTLLKRSPKLRYKLSTLSEMIDCGTPCNLINSQM